MKEKIKDGRKINNKFNSDQTSLKGSCRKRKQREVVKKVGWGGEGKEKIGKLPD